jgi:hypothetical protein
MSTPSASTSVTVNCETIKAEQLSQLATSSADTASRQVVFNPHSDADSSHEKEFQPGYWLYTGSSTANANDFGEYDKVMSSDHNTDQNVQVRQFLNPFSVPKSTVGLEGDNLKAHVRRQILDNVSVVGLCDSQNGGNGQGIVAMVGGGLFALKNNGPDYFKYGDIVLYDVPDIEVNGTNISTEPCSRLISRSLGAYIPYSAEKFVDLVIQDTRDKEVAFVEGKYGNNNLSSGFNDMVKGKDYTDANPGAEKAAVVDAFLNGYVNITANYGEIRKFFGSPEMKKYQSLNSFDGTEAVLNHFATTVGSSDHSCFTFYQMLKQAVEAVKDPVNFGKYHNASVNMQSNILLDHLTRKKGICMKPGGPGETISVMLT